MITLLLVEDEAEAREGLTKFIPWQSVGIDRLVEAANGLAAVDLCEAVLPDILLTDVRMPKMDGIQLAFYVRERFPACKIIFISGYSDKDYLKSAIKIGAVSYIEKPIDIQELQQTLALAVAQCEHDRKRLEEEEYRSAVTREGLPLILQKLAASACYGGRGGEDGRTLARHLGIGIEPCPVSTLVVKMHEDGALTNVEGEYFRNDIVAYLNGGAGQSAGMRLAACFLDGRTLAVHCFFPGSPDIERRSLALSRFVSDLNGRYAGKYLFTAATGDSAEEPCDIAQVFQSSMRLVKTLFYRRKGELHTACSTRETTYELPDDFVNEFDRLIVQNNPHDVHCWLDRLEESICRHPFTDIGYVKNIYFGFYEQLSLAAKRRNVKIGVLEGDDAYFWQELSKMETLHDITLYFHSLTNSFVSAIGMAVSAGSAIQEITGYIQAHFHEADLSIKRIAEFSHYDYYYLCSLFKKNTKMTINDYIARIRVEKAIELLKNRHVRLHDITGMVGYSDPSYFTKLFKKHVGSTPSEFREKHYS